MTDHQPLTAEQLEELKSLLLARRDDLRAQMVQNHANLQFPEASDSNLLRDEETGVINQTREVDAVLTSLDEQELARIDRALDDIEAGSYGLCEECGCQIPFERLKIEPMTKHCVNCKSAWEARQAAVRT